MQSVCTVMKAFYASVRRLKTFCLFEAIPTPEEYETLSSFHREIINEIWSILPSDPATASLALESLPYAVAVDAVSFLPSYCLLARMMEAHNCPLFSPIPLMSSLIQRHAIIDTKILSLHILDISDLVYRHTPKDIL